MPVPALTRVEVVAHPTPPYTPTSQVNNTPQSLDGDPPTVGSISRPRAVSSPLDHSGGNDQSAEKGTIFRNKSLSHSTRKSSPKIVGQKFEDGVLKIIYDPDELKQYREENGLLEPEKPEQAKLDMPLLPLSSGGHDPKSAGNRSFSVAHTTQATNLGQIDKNRSTRRLSESGDYHPPHHWRNVNGAPDESRTAEHHGQPRPFHRPDSPPYPRSQRHFAGRLLPQLHVPGPFANLDHHGNLQQDETGRFSARAVEARNEKATDGWVAETGIW